MSALGRDCMIFILRYSKITLLLTAVCRTFSLFFQNLVLICLKFFQFLAFPQLVLRFVVVASVH